VAWEIPATGLFIFCSDNFELGLRLADQLLVVAERRLRVVNDAGAASSDAILRNLLRGLKSTAAFKT